MRTAIRIVLEAVSSGSITYEDAEILIGAIYYHSTTTDIQRPNTIYKDQ